MATESAALPSVTVIVPCLDEELGVGTVLHELREALPHAALWVVDNNSTDNTSAAAREAGADRVIFEGRPGKAVAVRTALDEVDTDLVILIDGDASYPGQGAAVLFDAWRKCHVDLLNGIRVPVSRQEEGDRSDSEFRPLHQMGSRVFAYVLKMLFGHHIQDVFSGLCLMTRRFYSHVPILSQGFELEMELTVQCLDKGFSYKEVEVPFRARAHGSQSKLRTVRDGLRILRLLLVLFRDYRPFPFFSICSSMLLALGLLSGYRPISDYIHTGYVSKVPTAILAASFVILSFLFFLTGLMLESGLRHHKELFQINMRNAHRCKARPECHDE